MTVTPSSAGQLCAQEDMPNLTTRFFSRRLHQSLSIRLKDDDDNDDNDDEDEDEDEEQDPRVVNEKVMPMVSATACSAGLSTKTLVS
ncbi:hypothetical protein BGZ83_000189 [Gryganskiella cystojenkinii]|nr:hypothetical protein BGZ83_000189 [Gryganskiella cystojenkinii]